MRSGHQRARDVLYVEYFHCQGKDVLKRILTYHVQRRETSGEYRMGEGKLTRRHTLANAIANAVYIHPMKQVRTEIKSTTQSRGQ